MPFYNVDMTYTVQFSLHIEAESKEEAERIARGRVNEKLGVDRCNSTPRGCWDYRFENDCAMAVEIAPNEFTG